MRWSTNRYNIVVAFVAVTTVRNFPSEKKCFSDRKLPTKDTTIGWLCSRTIKTKVPGWDFEQNTIQVSNKLRNFRLKTIFSISILAIICEIAGWQRLPTAFVIFTIAIDTSFVIGPILYSYLAELFASTKVDFSTFEPFLKI